MKSYSLICAITTAGLLYTSIAADSPPTNRPEAAGDGLQVGVGKRDGITVAGAEAFITRNGATEKMVNELALPSGVIVRPDGTIILPDKSATTLKASQMLSFEGKVLEIPPDPNVNPAPPVTARTSGQTGSAPGSGVAGGQGVSAGGKAGSMKEDRRTQNGGGSVGTTDGGFTDGNILGADGTTTQDVRNFIDRNGNQFTGTINQDGSVNTLDGRSVVNDGTLRTTRIDQNGNTVQGTVSRNGTTNYNDGTVVSQNGTTRTADGRVLAPGQNPNAGNNGNAQSGNAAATGVMGSTPPPGNQNGAGNSPNNTGTLNRGDGAGGGNSPNNTGTVNNGNNPNGAAANNTGTVNNPNGNPITGQGATGQPNAGGQAGANAGTGGSRATGGARSGGSTGGSSGRSGSSGSGGASGGGGGAGGGGAAK